MKNLKKIPRGRVLVHRQGSNAVEASIIKSWNSNTTAVLLTYHLQEQPCQNYIAGQPSDTTVYKYQDRFIDMSYLQQIRTHKNNMQTERSLSK